MAKKYVVAKGEAIVTKGVIFKDGDEVKETDFVKKEVFEANIKAKKIVEAGEATEKKADADPGKGSGDPNKKNAGTSATGATK